MAIKYIEPEGILVVEDNIIPVYRGDTEESIVNRIDDTRIPYSKTFIDGKLVLIKDHVLRDIIIDFKISL